MSRRSPSAEPAARRAAPAPRIAKASDAAVRRSWRDLFRKHVRLVRQGLDFRFVLMDPAAAAAADKAKRQKSRIKTTKAAAPKSRASQNLDAARLTLMRNELRALLKRHVQARSLARHLAYFERELHKSGARAFDDVPVDVLRKALIQIEFLVSNWSAVGLAELRSRLAIAVSDREAEVQGAESLQDLRTLKGTAMSVQDATVSQFMEMQKSWLQPPPGGAALTPRDDKAGEEPPAA